MKYQKIHLKDFPAVKTYLLINKNLRKSILEEAIINQKCENYNQLAKIINKKSLAYYRNSSGFSAGDISLWLSGSRQDSRTGKIHPKCMPLWVLLELVKLSNCNIHDVERNVLLYRSGGKGKPIYSPKLPLLVTPEFESVVIHFFSDGYAGTGITPSYCQYNKEAREMFIQKLKNCFGSFDEVFYEKDKIVRFPMIITDIMTKYYNIQSYHSFKASIPPIMFNRSKLHRLALVVAFIQDEGNIRELILFTSVNLTFLSQIKILTESCGYSCNKIKFDKAGRVYRFTMSNKDIVKFAKDLSILTKLFPTCDLFWKNKYLSGILNRKSWRNYINLESRIIATLQNKKLSIKDIALEVGCSYTMVRKRIKQLYLNRGVGKEKVGLSWIWHIK